MSETYKVNYDIQSLPLGLDTSAGNGSINITKPGSPALAFGSAKCGEGTYRDPLYLSTRAQYDKAGLPFLAYYVLRHSGDSISQQVKNFISWAGSGCYAYSPDLEKTRDSESISKSLVSANTRDFIAGLLDAGLKVIPYSSAGWINEKFRSPSTYLLPTWVTSLDWWLARYSYIGENSVFYIPTGIAQNKVKILQTWNLAPNKYGSIYDSLFLDMDRWAVDYPGTVAQVPSSEDDPVATPNTFTVTPLYKLVIRSSPEKSNNDTGYRALKGISLAAYETATDSLGNTWARISTGWIAIKYNGTVYSKINKDADHGTNR